MWKCALSPVLRQPLVKMFLLKSQPRMELPLVKEKAAPYNLSSRPEIVTYIYYGHLFYAANSDYNSLVNEVLTFMSTSLQRQCVDIGIIDDALVEPIEQFVVRLSQLEIQQEDEAVVSITDNDGN